MNATPQRQSDDPVIEPLGPGPRLRAARERLELSLDEVGERLHLHVSTVEALEANAYGELPAPTFVRGYLRGYAQLVGLAPEPVVDEFDSQGLAPPALVADISEGPQARTTDLPMRLATWGILAALVVLVVMWWNSQTAGVDLGADSSQEVAEASGEPGAAGASQQIDAPEAGEAGSDEAGSTPDGSGQGDSAQADSMQAESTQAASMQPESAQAVAEPTEAYTDTRSPPGDAARDAGIGIGAAAAEPATASDGISPPDALVDDSAREGTRQPALAPAEALARDLDATSAPASADVTLADATLADATDSTATGAMTGLDVEPPAALGTSAAPTALEAGAGPAVDTTQPDPDAGSLALALAPTTTDPAAESLAAASMPASAGDERLVLRFAAESWVEIYDRDEQRLYFDLVEPDGVIDVAGPGPLRVLLGRAEGVVAAHNGEALDITPYISRGGIARFTVSTPTGQ